MRNVELINISEIKMDRHPLNPSTLRLIEHLDHGGSVPPIHIARLRTGRFLIRDGRHRVTAFKLLGRDKIESKFSDKYMGKLKGD